MDSKNPFVLMVGGWSPGPLMYLKSFLASRRCSVVEPHHLPMPPFPGTWCCHPKVLAMLIVLGVLMWLSFTSHSHILWNVSAILGSLIWFRLLALVVVRTSIQMSAQTCLDAIRQHDGKLILIGFSWGGAVLAELLANRKMGDQPLTLLIAPTTSLVASIAMERDAASRVDYTNATIHVVHGTGDLAFCPNQERWTTSIGVTLHRLHDNHVFFRQSSQRKLVDILSQLLQAAEAD